MVYNEDFIFVWSKMKEKKNQTTKEHAVIVS